MDAPASKTQNIVRAALGLKPAGWYSNAERDFEEMGISVRAVRQGRTFVPSITLSRPSAVFSADGDGVDNGGGHSLTAEQVAAISEWIAK